MTRTTRTTTAARALLVLLAAAFALASGASAGDAPATKNAEPAINRDAMAALDRLGAYLRALQAFQVQATVTTDDVLEDGTKVEHDSLVNVLVQRPNRLRAEVSSYEKDRMFFYDGTTFTMWARRADYFATVPAPPTLAALVTQLEVKHGIELPLTDLFAWGTDKARTREITSAIDVGPTQINGVSCEQYAFRQPGLDWQVWIQQGDYPLPLRLVLTTTTDEARPQHSATYAWNLAPAFDDTAFRFVPGPGSKKIVLSDTRKDDTRGVGK